MPLNLSSPGLYNKAKIFLGLIEYELNILFASHLVGYISVHIQFDLERYLLIIILISKHALFRMMQIYLRPVINCFLCCMNWYSWGVILQFASYLYTFGSCSYGCKICYVTDAFLIGITLHWCSSNENSHKKLLSITNGPFFLRPNSRPCFSNFSSALGPTFSFYPFFHLSALGLSTWSIVCALGCRK